MKTIQHNGEQASELNAIEVVELMSCHKMDPVRKLIEDLQTQIGFEVRTIKAKVMYAKTELSLECETNDGEPHALIISLRHWLNSYAGCRVCSAKDTTHYALMSDREWVNL